MIKLAAIDIGSNAVRLMLSCVYESKAETTFIKESLVRVPLRLGEDVFTHQRITKEKIERLGTVMLAFRHLIEAYEAVDVIACATSAMREAKNGKEVAKAVKKRSGLDVEIIEGKREAAIIYSSHVGLMLKLNSPLLYVDVGGGSTELTLLLRNKIIESASFKIGTVRMLKKGRPKLEWERMKTWLRNNVEPHHPIAAIGTGGSINNIFRLSRKKEGKPISYKLIKEIREFVNSYTVDERIKILGLRPDRADVIVGASDIYLGVMKSAGVKQMYVPMLGLCDGLIHVLYEKIKAKHIDI